MFSFIKLQKVNLRIKDCKFFIKSSKIFIGGFSLQVPTVYPIFLQVTKIFKLDCPFQLHLKYFFYTIKNKSQYGWFLLNSVTILSGHTITNLSD